MAFSASDIVNLAASVASLAGAGVSVGGFINKRMKRNVPSQIPQPIAGQGPRSTEQYHPYAAPSPRPPQPQVAPSSAPIIQQHVPPMSPMPAPQVQYPQYPPRQRLVNHPLILTAAILGIVVVLAYLLELFITTALTGDSGVPTGSTLFYFNIVLVGLNLLCCFGALIAMAIIAVQAKATRWLIASIGLLLLGLCSLGYALGIFSIVGLVPAFFFGLSAPIALERIPHLA